ncbi:hypothetical protein SB767_28495, partial [Bacillus sp. SIMBA_069]
MAHRRWISAVGTLGAVLALSVASPAVAVAPSSAPVGQPAQANGGLTVKDVHILGPVDQNAHVAARDNGQSVEYHGKSYWFFD